MKLQQQFGPRPSAKLIATLSPARREYFEERAAIAEYHGNLSRRDAEALAWSLTMTGGGR